MLEDAEEFVGYFRLRPQKRLQTLHPFEVGNDHATGVAKNVRDNENFVPALVRECRSASGRGRAVGAFGKDAALELAGIFFGNHAIDCARSKNVARQREQLVRIYMIVLSERPQVAFFDMCCSAAFTSMPFGL